MAPKIKIAYYPTKSHAGPSRQALTGDLEDKRIFGEHTADVKATGLLPFQSLPTMKVDNDVYAESTAILRYAGKLSGLYPKCDEAALNVDRVVDALETVLVAVFKDSSEAGRAKFVSETVPRYLGPMDAMYARTKGAFLLGDEMSIADIKLGVIMDALLSGVIDQVLTSSLEKYSHLMAAWKAVEAK